MKNNFFSGLLLISLLCSCQSDEGKKSILSGKDVERIVLVGGSLISSMEDHAFFETALTTHFYDQAFSFRNIGWPADDVYGLARSQFGSAQNTRSWQPPSAEKGFGSKVLMQHIEEAAPTTLIIGYGGEAAFAENEEDFKLFTSGYTRLLDFVAKQKTKVILLTPPKHEVAFSTTKECQERNDWLGKASRFIKAQAADRGYLVIDLYEELIQDPIKQLYTVNGMQLHEKGYEQLSAILLQNLKIAPAESFAITLDSQAAVLQTQNCQITDWVSTVRGVSFNVTPDQFLHAGQIISKEPVAVYINGQLAANSQDTISFVNLIADSLRHARLVNTIKEKNRLRRYRLRPLNEAYIYLFRRHEMGHLAYEMDDLSRLVEEKEKEISRLFVEHTYDVEIELIQPWKSPKDYPEDEVPTFVPEPDIEAELAAFHIAEGYEMSLFASDPMIANPININWDTRGRAWVATSSTYPHIVPGREPNDKIIILEDTDQDGVADKHTVFAENLLIPHSVMPVPGGAYVTATTQLLFLADTDGDDVADELRVVYDGFGNADVHHMIHGLRWAPWGDLYFTQSIYINSFVETPYGPRVLNGSGTWTFRPESEHLDVFTRGLINPWGQAFDQWGQAFATDGAGFSGINYIFPESAHATAVGAPQVLPGLNRNKPKNTGAEVIYSRHFPAEWQGSIITNDFRANRTVRYQLETDESGYTSEEVQTVLRSDHRSYRPVDTKIGPDGALYIVDWYNPIIDHGEVDFHHPIRDRKHGRVWKLTKKGSPLLPVINMQELSPTALLNYLKSPEQFTRLQANRAYVERNGSPDLVLDWIKRLPSNQAAARHRLEGLWLLAALNHYDEPLLRASLQATNPRERAAAIRLLGHYQKQAEYLPILTGLIVDDHPQVRLEVLHTLRAMGGHSASALAMQVLNKPMDENLEFALQLTINSLKEAWLPTMAQGQQLFGGNKEHQLYALTAIEDPRAISPILQLLEQSSLDTILTKRAWLQLAKIGDAGARTKVLQKAATESNVRLLRALANAPAANDAVPDDLGILESLLTDENERIRLAALQLARRWKAKQYAQLISGIAQKAEEVDEKVAACRALVAIEQLSQVQEWAQSASDPQIRTAASAVWVEEDTEAAVDNAVRWLQELKEPDLAELMFVTFRRQDNGPAILQKALSGKTIPEAIASAGLKVVQTSGLNLFDLEETIRASGGIKAVGLELSRADKDQLIAEALEVENPYRGRAIYRKQELLCASCHRINNSGGLIGPDLSTVGSYMTPNSILESILNPNADIKQGYETVQLTRTNGEIVSGLLHRKTNNSTLIRQTNNEIIEIPAEEIAKLDVSSVSLMPPGLTQGLHRDELKDLVAYLINLGVER